MKDLFKNIRSEKITSGTGLAMIVLLVAKLAGLDLGTVTGIPIENLAIYLGSALQAVLLLFAKDPKNNYNNQKKQ